ncbi:hypothetical protein TcasGA2_TC033939 [Tribolium castaneum]|uniref:Lipoprotein n=1 Tax=Tribolium castaneum TaxID=7070 RepID=A0A139WDR8_TRICA|nr:hypothetical protein TcasGA2_TC033939 [Tribolium castaneum]
MKKEIFIGLDLMKLIILTASLSTSCKAFGIRLTARA